MLLVVTLIPVPHIPSHSYFFGSFLLLNGKHMCMSHLFKCASFLNRLRWSVTMKLANQSSGGEVVYVRRKPLNVSRWQFFFHEMNAHELVWLILNFRFIYFISLNYYIDIITQILLVDHMGLKSPPQTGCTVQQVMHAQVAQAMALSEQIIFFENSKHFESKKCELDL